MKRKALTYQSTGVSYDVLDAFKRLAQKEAATTGTNKSRGESAFVWEEKDQYRAMVIEGLGTKNLVADEMRPISGKTHYDTIAQDTVAMIVNDLVVVGAKPEVVTAYFAVGDSAWFADKKRVADLVKGWAKACRLAGVVWGGGETPTLKGIIGKQTIDLAGSAVGSIRPKKRLVTGDALKVGDAIVLIESSGIHANGLTLARKVVQRLPQGYATRLADGVSFGEAILRPTHIYAKLVSDFFDGGITLHYIVNITGHGWRKLMRAKREFTYRIDFVPEVSPLFSTIARYSGNNSEEMYANFNMGAGFAVFVPQKDVAKAIQVARTHGFIAWKAGVVCEGPKQVIISPLGITYKESSMKLRI